MFEKALTIINTKNQKITNVVEIKKNLNTEIKVVNNT